MAEKQFTVCVLLYGNYPLLASRCLRTIVRVLGSQNVALRVGLNACSAETLSVVLAELKDWPVADVVFQNSESNLHKYPMMRRLLYDPANPVQTPWVMWFDDDSFFRPDAKAAAWLPQFTAWLDKEKVDVAGSLYSMRLTPNQLNWLKAQAWYRSKPLHASYTVRFATGGWWCARTELLRAYDWPIPALDHRGGDVMLGALCAQQELNLRHWNTGVAINADEHGRESQAQRRGFDQPPIGHNYQPRSLIRTPQDA